MVTLEQVKLLESKVSRAIDYVKKVTDENRALKHKLDKNQKRIDELEVLIHQFKDEQSRIEGGILSALDRLNQFEDAVEGLLTTEGKPAGGEPRPAKAKNESRKEEKAPEPVVQEPAVLEPVIEELQPLAEEESINSGELDIF